MTGSGYVWIVTEQALESLHVPSGTLGIQLVSIFIKLFFSFVADVWDK
jgi:hypothetical protein